MRRVGIIFVILIGSVLAGCMLPAGTRLVKSEELAARPGTPIPTSIVRRQMRRDYLSPLAEGGKGRTYELGYDYFLVANGSEHRMPFLARPPAALNVREIETNIRCIAGTNRWVACRPITRTPLPLMQVDADLIVFDDDLHHTLVHLERLPREFSRTSMLAGTFTWSEGNRSVKWTAEGREHTLALDSIPLDR